MVPIQRSEENGVRTRGSPGKRGSTATDNFTIKEELEMEKGKKVKWYYRPVPLLILLFLVIGPFALPLLYKSPCFNKTWKVILTIAVIVFTVYVIIVSIEITKNILAVINGAT